uniref:Uncharacterized protein n=1 Tax=Rhizophora mucronata TaxID=61149 RepID=A0A2P2PN26_RHIMU
MNSRKLSGTLEYETRQKLMATLSGSGFELKNFVILPLQKGGTRYFLKRKLIYCLNILGDICILHFPIHQRLLAGTDCFLPLDSGWKMGCRFYLRIFQLSEWDCGPNRNDSRGSL